MTQATQTEIIDDKKIKHRSLLHSCYVQDNGRNEDAVIISEIVEFEDGTTKPNLRTWKRPRVPVWVTQEGLRVHPDKKEFESIKQLDKYDVDYKDKDRELFRILNGYTPNYMTPNQRRKVMQSPYVYGANIAIEAHAAMRYKENLLKQGKIAIPHEASTGFFDIEQSLLPESLGALPLLVFVTGNQVFLAMKKIFMTELRGTKRVAVSIEDVEEGARRIIDPLVESMFDENDSFEEHRGKLPFVYNFYIGDTEVDLIRWIFGKMHEMQTAYIGVWNLGFDIPEIIKVLDKHNIPLEEIFSHPSLRGTGFSYAHYKDDKRDVQHHTQKWHWLSNTAHFQFVDSMALYSYIRVVDGKETSYKLDHILKKFGLGGKLKIDEVSHLSELQEPDWHRAMLRDHFVAYALYAMWDGISLQLLEWLNRDINAMRAMCDVTPPKFFPNQTIKVTNTLYEEWKQKGQILGTGVDLESPRDDELPNLGGAVLTPQNLNAKGLKLFVEYPSHHTQVYAFVDDLDFGALYPTIGSSVNISKQTKISTMFCIKADHVQKYYKPEEAVEVFSSYLITPESSGYDMGVEFFGLPTYSEISALFEQRKAA